MVQISYMDIEDLTQLIAKSTLSDRRISLNCGERHTFVGDIRRGIKPAFDSVFKLLEVLGYDVHITPKDGQQAGPPRRAKSGKTEGSFSTFEDAGEAGQGLAPVRDRQLAEVLAVIIEHYEQNNEYGRRNFIAEVKARWPTLFADGGAPLARVVAWLGWKVLPGAASQRKNAKGD